MELCSILANKFEIPLKCSERHQIAKISSLNAFGTEILTFQIYETKFLKDLRLSFKVI